VSEHRTLRAVEVSAAFRDADGHRIEVLDAVDFAPAPGAVTVVTGPSGSGKSTLFNVLAGLVPPTSGSIVFDGLDITALAESRRDRWRRMSLGLVFQNFNLIDELGPLDNVTVAALFASFTAGAHRRRGEALLERLGVPTRRRSLAGMSRGERQRIAVARALLFDPPVILADEPTASLDRAAGSAVAAILTDLARGGRTVVVVSHDPVVIAAADRVLRLSSGRLEPWQAEVA
jgi:putative ABC transport system ATP-binding protein